jgi:hypothetical protein
MPACIHRRRRRFTGTLAAAVLVTALAAPNAVARPDAFRPHAAELAPDVTNTTRTPAPTVTRRIDDGFDVGSAAIGAGGAAAGLLLATGGFAAISRRRRIGVVR